MITMRYGVPGAGKSLALHDAVRDETRYRIFIIEHSDEWEPRSGHWRGRPPKIHTVHSREDLPDPMPAAGVFVCVGMEAAEVAQMAIDYGPSVFVDDEADLSARKQGWEENPIRRMVHQGRHLPNRHGQICHVHFWGACRRPQNLATDLTDLVTEVFIFRCQGNRTLSRLEDDGMIDETERDEVAALENFDFIHWPSKKRMSIQPF